MATQTDLHAAMTPTRIGSLIATIDGVAVSITSGRYWHVDLSTADNGIVSLKSALNTAIGASANSVTCSFDASDLTYTLSGTGTFSATLGAILAGALGMATSLASASSYTSTKRPLYVIRPLLATAGLAAGYAPRSNVSGKFYPSGRTRVRYSDDGARSYAISPLGMPKHYDWQHRYERDTPLYDGGTYVGGAGHAMMSDDVTATMPWSWEHFFDLVRAEEFFAFTSQTDPTSACTGELYKMREETSEFTQQARRRGGQDTPYWDVSISAIRFASQ